MFTLRNASIAAVSLMFIVPFLAWLLIPDISGSVLIMLAIAVIAFFTVVFVMIIGSQEDHYPKDAKDSNAVQRWNERAGNGESATE